MGRKGRTKNWFWIQVKLAISRSAFGIKLFQYQYFSTLNLIIIISHFFRKKLKRNEFQIEDSFHI